MPASSTLLASVAPTPAYVPPAPYPASIVTPWTKATRPARTAFRFVADVDGALVALPALGAVFGAFWLVPYGDAVPFLVQSVTVGGGAVLGAFLTLPLVRWVPVESR